MSLFICALLSADDDGHRWYLAMGDHDEPVVARRGQGADQQPLRERAEAMELATVARWFDDVEKMIANDRAIGADGNSKNSIHRRMHGCAVEALAILRGVIRDAVRRAVAK